MSEFESLYWFWEVMQAWYMKNGRDLPWRHHPGPYEVWVSEIMLQQTQVVTVIPYYLRWMERFPTLQKLAQSSLDEVRQMWSGLGYYRRASYLHKGAQVIVDEYGGEFPKTVQELQKIPGIGAYTAGAIASFAFGQNEPAIDGNIERVLSRFLGIGGDLKKESRKILENSARQLANLGSCHIINQAMMDLGASFCGKTANCENCPVSKKCEALRLGLTESLPQKQVRQTKTDEFRAGLWLTRSDGCVLIAKRKDDRLLGGLWEIPMVSFSRGKGREHLKSAEQKMRISRELFWKSWLHYDYLQQLQGVDRRKIVVLHTFTHIQMRVYVDEAIVPESSQKHCQNIDLPMIPDDSDYSEYAFVRIEEIDKKYAISTLMRKIMSVTFQS